MKKISALALCIILMLSLAMPVGARNFQCSYTVNSNDLLVTGASTNKEANVTVTVDGKAVEAEVSTVMSEAVPVTYFLMEDCSSGLSDYQKALQDTVISSIAARIRPMDKLVVAQMSRKELILSSVLTNQEEIDTVISTPLPYGWGVTLFDNLIEMVSILQDSETYPGMKCAIVISDGRDDQMTSTRAEDAIAVIKSSDVSLYGIALHNQQVTDYSRALTEKLSDLCTASSDGACIAVDSSTIDAEAAANRVMDLIQNRIVVKLNAEKLERGGDHVEVAVAVGDMTGNVTVPVSDLPAYVPAVTEATTVPVEVTTAPVTVPETQAAPTTAVSAPASSSASKGFDIASLFAPLFALLPQRDSNMTFYLLIGSGIAAIVAAIVILILLFRPQNDYEDVPDRITAVDDMEFMDIPDAVDEGPVINLDLSNDTWQERPAKPVPILQDIHINGSSTGCSVQFISTLDDEIALDLHLSVNEGKTVGRNARSNCILCEADSSLSGLHFEILWDGRALQLRDRSSTNGTMVNGISAAPERWMMVENGSSIAAGSYAYKIVYKKETL